MDNYAGRTPRGRPHRGILHVELDRLACLGQTVQSLAHEAESLRTGPSAGPYASMPGAVMPAILEASGIAHDLVDTALVTAVTNRLSQTSRTMADMARQYCSADDTISSVDAMTGSYTHALETWDVLAAPK
jgi:hypothetical protein